jgi:hydroxypyruvate reductase
MTAAFGISGARSLRADAIDIWSAGVAVVDSARLVRSSVRVYGRVLEICGHRCELDETTHICVVGAGKAGAGMSAGLEEALGDELLHHRVTGWVNVPADCVLSLQRIHLHAARPAGLNEPTADGVAGAERILQMVSDLAPQDVCIVLLSGGGSALLPAPVPGVSLADKQAVTRFLSRAGAGILELNCVRKQLSRIKGGRLAAACRAGTLIALIISDVIGDPLDVIASGPTVSDTQSPAAALSVLQRFDPDGSDTPRSVINHLRSAQRSDEPRASSAQVVNHVIGNNRLALQACAMRAREFGYQLESIEEGCTGEARDEGIRFANQCRRLRNSLRTDDVARCILSGGEPVVHVEPTGRPQLGGRNQEFVLAALERLWPDGADRICILSGGTDGEDGPTDAAGAVLDSDLVARAREQNFAPQPFLADHNAYPFFESTGGLIRTGPTGTNVMDVRVALVAPPPDVPASTTPS